MHDYTRAQITVGPLVFDTIQAGPFDGETVILLHGFPEYADSWQDLIGPLAGAGYRAVAIDQRGYSPGARPEAVEDYALDLLVHDVLHCADALGADRFHLAGHDFGGVVAWALAAEHPERLHTLSVFSTPHLAAFHQALNGPGDQRTRSSYIKLFRAPDHQAERELLADDAKRIDAMFDETGSPELRASTVERITRPGALTAGLNWYRAVFDDDLNVPIGDITVPTLYVWGVEDVALGREAAELTRNHVTGEYRFLPLAGSGHWLPQADTHRFLPDLLQHLDRR